MSCYLETVLHLVINRNWVSRLIPTTKIIYVTQTNRLLLQTCSRELNGMQKQESLFVFCCFFVSIAFFWRGCVGFQVESPPPLFVQFFLPFDLSLSTVKIWGPRYLFSLVLFYLVIGIILTSLAVSCCNNCPFAVAGRQDRRPNPY